MKLESETKVGKGNLQRMLCNVLGSPGFIIGCEKMLKNFDQLSGMLRFVFQWEEWLWKEWCRQD